MRIKPIGNYVLVDTEEKIEKTKHGLLTGGIKGEKTEAYAIRGTVVSIGSAAQSYEGPSGIAIRIEFKLKDDVLVSKWEGQMASSGGKNYILVKPEHIIAILEK